SLAMRIPELPLRPEVEAFLVERAGGRLGWLEEVVSQQLPWALAPRGHGVTSSWVGDRLTRRHADGLPAASRTRTHPRPDGARAFTRAEYWRLRFVRLTIRLVVAPRAVSAYGECRRYPTVSAVAG
ncbi:MAG TPA: hypothetical protein VK631_21490, partial [Solirubrobacteraceae bacterium]|nr:hypothetical protein [Solirubrobacteraceae bacterium]